MSNLAKAVAILTFVCALAAGGAWYLAHGRAAAQDAASATAVSWLRSACSARSAALTAGSPSSRAPASSRA